MQKNNRTHLVEIQKPTAGITTILWAAILLCQMLPARSQPTLPGIVQQPTNLMPYVGGSVAFSVVATGAPPISFQWRFRGADLPGKTNSVFSVPSARFTNAGPYSVVVSNAGGPVTSATAWLSVLPTNVVNLGDVELGFGEPSAPIWEAALKNDDYPSLTGDGLTLFYGSSAPGGSGGQDIWMVKRPTLTSPWGTPVNLGPTINSPADDSAPTLSRDGLSLYFASNRAGGRGGWDVWVATRPSLSAPFGSPVNLGPAINTSFGEGDPHISPDNRTLVFSSTRLNDPNANDVFMSTRTNASAQWEPARYLPAPINHSGDTFPVEISPDGLLLFVKSWRPISGIPGANPTHGIYVCPRSNQDESFGAPVLIQPLLGLPHESDICSLSDDGTILCVGTYRTGFPNWAQVLQMSVTALPQLTSPRRGASGEFQFDLVGREGATYEIQASPNFSTWSLWLITNSTGTTRLSDSTPAPEGRRFYRALSH
jgi:hypothetical protein